MKKENIYIILFIISDGFIINSSVLNLLQNNEDNSAISGSGYFLILFMVFSFVYIIRNYNILLKSHILLKSALVYGTLALLINLLYFKGLFFDLIRTSNAIFQWVFALIVGYMIAFKDQKNKNRTIFLLLIATLPVTLYNIFNYSFESVFQLQVFNVFDATFILLVILPFVFTLKNDLLKIILVVLIGVVAFMSFKRTTIISYIIVVVLYYVNTIFSGGLNSKSRNKYLLIFSVIIGALIIYQSFNYIEKVSGGLISERLNKMQEDRGSERLDIYSNILNLLSTSSSQSLLFGHGGYRAVELKLKILAHNDFLEILYDFGIVTFIAYFVFFIQLTKYIGRILKYKKIIPIENRNAYIVAYILFLFLGILNCFITSPVYYATIMFYFGLEIGNIERIIKTKNHFIISEQDY